MPNELDVAKQFEIVITNEQKELVRRTIAPDATDAELQLFFYDCTRRGVHPLDKLIHFTKRNGKYTPITSIDMFRQRAGESGEHMGTDEAVFEGEGEYPDKATVTVYKKVQGEKCAFTASARWAEYKPEPGPSGKADVMWRKMPTLMLAKCAEALALRKAFPAQLHGLYTPEEMAQAGPPIRQADNGQQAEAVVPAPPVKPVTLDAPAPFTVAAFCLEQAEHAPESVIDIPKFTFGKHKGKAVNDPSIPDDYLSWIEGSLQGQMTDPKYARYREEKQRMLDAIRGELIDRNAMPMEE